MRKVSTRRRWDDGGEKRVASRLIRTDGFVDGKQREAVVEAVDEAVNEDTLNDFDDDGVYRQRDCETMVDRGYKRNCFAKTYRVADRYAVWQWLKLWMRIS